MELFDLHGKVAIVTGGNGGIGLGIARGLAQAGADIAVAARNPDKTRMAVEQLGGLGVRAVGVHVDVTDATQIQKMVADSVDALGGVDILVANAGMSIRKRPETYSIDEWSTVVTTNLTGVFACCHAVYPQLKARGGGKIVTIGSMTSIFGLDMGAPYAATKGGVVQLTRSLASAWARDNIQVNCILPGWIDTELTQGARRAMPRLDESVVDRTPQKRWGRPEDLAGAALFYCAAASDFVTGTSLAVDGGFSSSMF
ncbi:MAG: glucose 1-dehydrogenase [Chloroflexi bacterium]|nr:glucose 1-dehydrogenase [Chloroflexota bacterium]MBV9597084.1 glucose 1-dehydrogenase [Chloroflexota bacterium]